VRAPSSENVSTCIHLYPPRKHCHTVYVFQSFSVGSGLDFCFLRFQRGCQTICRAPLCPRQRPAHVASSLGQHGVQFAQGLLVSKLRGVSPINDRLDLCKQLIFYLAQIRCGGTRRRHLRSRQLCFCRGGAALDHDRKTVGGSLTLGVGRHRKHRLRHLLGTITADPCSHHQSLLSAAAPRRRQQQRWCSALRCYAAISVTNRLHVY
jgi:hypothetical protein